MENLHKKTFERKKEKKKEIENLSKKTSKRKKGRKKERKVSYNYSTAD